MNEQERGDIAMVLMRFFSEAKKEGTIGHGIKCLDDAVNEIDRLLTTRAVPTVDDDAVERAENEAWAKIIHHSDMGQVPWANNLARAAMEYGIEAGINAAAGITQGDAREGGGEQADPPIELRVVNEINKRHNEQHPDKQLPTLEDDGFVANHWPGHPRP